MKDLGGGRAILEIHNRLGKLGYAVEHNVLKAEEYGVPQERRRIVFLGTRLGTPIAWPEAENGDQEDLFGEQLPPFVTVSQAIGDLPTLGSGEGIDGLVPYSRKAAAAYQRAMRTGSKGVSNHTAPRLATINLERMKFIRPGGSWRDLPVRLLPAGMKRAKRSDHTKRYGRLHPEGLASTILTKCDPHWGAFIHPDQERAITVREAARLQSFPDRFVFLGSRVDQYRQVGNAVLPLLARAVARTIRTMLRPESPKKARMSVGI